LKIFTNINLSCLFKNIDLFKSKDFLLILSLLIKETNFYRFFFLEKYWFLLNFMQNNIEFLLQIRLIYSDCKFSCHWKCLNNVCRVCVHVVASEAGGYTHTKDICPEQGLSKQGYRCAECKVRITFSKYL